MADEPDNLVLRGPNRLRDQNDLILRKLDELITRVSALQRDVAAIKVDYANTQLRRLELAEAE